MRKNLVILLLASIAILSAAEPFGLLFVKQDGYGVGGLDLYAVRVCNSTDAPITVYGSVVIGYAQMHGIHVAQNFIVQRELAKADKEIERRSKWRWYRYTLLATEFAGWGLAFAAIGDAWNMSGATRQRVAAVGTAVGVGVRSLTTIYRHEAPLPVLRPDNMLPSLISLAPQPSCTDYSFYATRRRQ